MNDLETAPQVVLVVDDEPINLQVVARALRADYHVKIATSGAKALEVALSDMPPDLILLDIMMPELDGYEVCRRLKSDPRTNNIPVIFITAMGEVGDEERGLGLGAVDYITKPFSLPIVQARVRTQLRLKWKSDMLERLVSLDALTEIPNRRRFDEVLEREWDRMRRDERPLSLIFIDVDFFKKFNDGYGHAVGDVCLKRVAGALRDIARHNGDFVARYGGEEFAVVLPGAPLERARSVAEMLREGVEGMAIPHVHRGDLAQVTISLGIGTFVPCAATTPVALIEAADAMLYGAKAAGRNRVHPAA